MKSIKDNIKYPLNYLNILDKLEQKLDDMIKKGEITELEKYGFHAEINGNSLNLFVGNKKIKCDKRTES